MNIKGDEVIVLPNGWMSRRSAAVYCGISVKTLAMYASHGTGPEFSKRGRCWYQKKKLDAWLEDGNVISSASARLNKA